MEWLHPVALEQEVAIDIEVAALVAVDLNSQSVLYPFLVQVLADVAEHGVAKITGIFTFTAHIIDVLPGTLERADHSVIAVNRSGDTGPDTLTLVAALDQGLAAGEGIVHGLALALVEDGWPSSITACHGSVIFILSVAVGETIPNED